MSDAAPPGAIVVSKYFHQLVSRDVNPVRREISSPVVATVEGATDAVYREIGLALVGSDSGKVSKSNAWRCADAGVIHVHFLQVLEQPSKQAQNAFML